MEIKYSEIIKYLVSLPEFTDDEVAEMSIEEVVDLYEMYHKD